MTTRLMTVMTIMTVLWGGGCTGLVSPAERVSQTDVALPAPSTSGGMALSESLATRRSARAFTDKAVTAEQLAQLCWAAQGITEQSSGKRTAPSAMAQYAVTVYVVNKEGCYEYLPASHALRPMGGTQALGALRGACWQPSVASAPVCLIVAMDVEKLRPRCGKMAEQYSLLEAGHVAQNVLLQATALGLASVPAGGFDQTAVAKALTIPATKQPVYLLPIGYKK